MWTPRISEELYISMVELSMPRAGSQLKCTKIMAKGLDLLSDSLGETRSIVSEDPVSKRVLML